MGAFVPKDYVAAIAACLAASNWDDLLDQFQTLCYKSFRSQNM